MNNLRQQIAQLPLADQLDGQEMMVVLQGSYLFTTPLQKAAESAVKVYAATITQSATDDPVAKIVANTVGHPVWSRVDANNYNLTLIGAFPADRTIIHNGVDTNGNYYYRFSEDVIRFVCPAGDGTVRDYPVKVEVYWYIITDIPSSLMAAVISDTEIDITWTAGADNYILEYSLDGVAFIPVYDGSGGAFNHTGLQPSTEYFYRLKAQTFGELDSDWVTTSATTNPA